MSKYNLLLRLGVLGGFFIILLTSFNPLYSVNLLLKLPFEKGVTFVLTRGYNTQTTHVGKDNFALDFTAGGCDSYDAPVLAVTAGVIERVDTGHVHGEVKSYGNSIVINHGDNVLSRYGHLNQVFVTSSERIVQGQIIGTQGNTGSVWGKECKSYPGTHLHFVMYTRGQDGTLTPHLPEPMSGYTDFIEGSEYTSDNEIIADIVSDTGIVENSSEFNSSELIQTEQHQKTSFIKTAWNRLSTFIVQLMKNVLSVTNVSEQQNDSESVSTPSVDVESQANNEDVEEVYDAKFTKTEIPISFVSDAKQVPVSIEIENIGNVDWSKNTISLNVVGGLNPNKVWYHPSWITQLRPVVISKVVGHGEKVTVSFSVSVPEVDRRLRLQLVRNNNGNYVQVGNEFSTIVLNEIVVTKPLEVGPVSMDGVDTEDGVGGSGENIEKSTIEESILDTDPETTEEDLPVEDTVTPVYIYSGGSGGGSSGNSHVDPEPEITATSTPEVSTTTEPLPSLTNLSFSNPIDLESIVYTSSSNYIFSGTSDENTQEIVVQKDGETISTSTPVDGVWDISVSLSVGTQSLTIFGTASEDRQTSSTIFTVVLDSDAPLLEIQLASLGEGLLTAEVTPYDDTPITSLLFEFFEITNYSGECNEGETSFEAPVVSFYLDENDVMQAEIVSTAVGCARIFDTQETTETTVSIEYDESFDIALRVKGTDSAGNVSDWWYSAIPLAAPLPDDVVIEF